MPRPPEPPPTLPLDSYVAVQLVYVESKERGRYGQPLDHHWETVVAWESAGTLEFCRNYCVEWELDPAYICRITGALEFAEVCEVEEPGIADDDMPLFAT